MPAQRRGSCRRPHSTGRSAPAFESGCAGAFVFSWTDEWHRGGKDVEDWDFGLTDRDREPKPALAAVAGAFADVPFPASGTGRECRSWSARYNGGRTLRETLQGIERSSTRTSRSSSSTTGRRTTPRRSQRSTTCGSSGLRTRAWAPLETSARGRDRRDRGVSRRRRLARSALAALPRAHLRSDGQRGGWRAEHPAPGRERGRGDAWRTRLAGRSTYSSLTPRPSTFRAATSDPERRAGGNSADSTRSSEPPATTSTSAGAFREPAVGSASDPAAVVWHHRRELGARVLAPATRLRACRGPARAKVAGPLQRERSPHVERDDLRGRQSADARPPTLARVLRALGNGLFQRLYQPAPSSDRCR